MKLKKKGQENDLSQLGSIPNRKQVEINYESQFLINMVLKNKILKIN